MNQTFKLLTLLLAVTLLTGCKGEDPDFTIDITEHFDKEFALQLEKREYITDAKKITLGDVKNIKELDVSVCELTSLAGIEYFSALDTLSCYGNQLTSLNVSNSVALKKLSCSSNQLATLDVSGCTALTYLDCIYNQLTTLDVSKNTMLKNLGCFNNQLTSLDISGCTRLTYLVCSSNQLTSLDISSNTSLEVFICYDNPGNGTVFPITAWFDNSNIPAVFFPIPKHGWWYDNGNMIYIEYIKK